VVGDTLGPVLDLGDGGIAFGDWQVVGEDETTQWVSGLIITDQHHEDQVRPTFATLARRLRVASIGKLTPASLVWRPMPVWSKRPVT
jgi:hypothetical protein